MGQRIFERLIEIRRATLSARVWLAVPDPAAWTKETKDMHAQSVISGVLFVHSKEDNPFDVAVAIEDQLRREGFEPNAVQVQDYCAHNEQSSAILYPDWP